MEINFEKRYIPIYTLIIAVAHHIILNINSIYENVIKDTWPIDAIILVFTLVFLSIFDRYQKERIALGIVWKKTPFENAKKYVKRDKRIDTKDIVIKELIDISNKDFYDKYYKPVRNNKIVNSKNSEYCILRDIVFTIFIITIIILFLTIKWPNYFFKELIACIIAYIIGLISCRRKAKDFVSQIVVEYIYQEEKEEK